MEIDPVYLKMAKRKLAGCCSVRRMFGPLESELLVDDSSQAQFRRVLILRFRAGNQPPYAFEWLDLNATSLDYGAILTRISRGYNRRFRNGNGGDNAAKPTRMRLRQRHLAIRIKVIRKRYFFQKPLEREK